MPEPAAHAITYVLKDNALLVNDRLELPYLATHADDIAISRHGEPLVVARHLADNFEIPAGYQLVAIRQLVSHWTVQQFEQTSRALQLLEWQRNHLFCSRCGHQAQPHPYEHAMLCPVCDYSQYPRIQPCVIVAITNGEQILLARSARRHTSMYGLIAGFVEVGETLEQAVARETLEEVGIHLKNIEYLASQPWPFPSNLMLGFKAEYAGGELCLQREEIADAAFFAFDQLPTIPPHGSIAYWLIEQTIQQSSTRPVSVPD
ncbi:NAD(+) diphosphatase [Alkanindiges sp. WGS2144]|uniref:NAD(+) diphosphatase n=1 Tax=Alkanindiges sp. WGS2144 TaxID=3366808 RepID=UPI003750A830